VLNNLSLFLNVLFSIYFLFFFFFFFFLFPNSQKVDARLLGLAKSGKMTDETGWQVLPVELQTIILSFLPPKVQISLQVKNSVSNTCVDIEHLAS